jgi:hypothetical protein
VCGWLWPSPGLTGVSAIGSTTGCSANGLPSPAPRPAAWEECLCTSTNSSTSALLYLDVLHAASRQEDRIPSLPPSSNQEDGPFPAAQVPLQLPAECLQGPHRAPKAASRPEVADPNLGRPPHPSPALRQLPTHRLLRQETPHQRLQAPHLHSAKRPPPFSCAPPPRLLRALERDSCFPARKASQLCSSEQAKSAEIPED